MKNAIILHGTLGSPEGNWFQWLKGELETKGYTVWLPQLPHAERPSLREEANYVQAKCPFPINEDTLVVGHSSGALLAIVLAQENKMLIGAMVCVSVLHDNSLNWDPNSRLFDVPYDWAAVHQHAPRLLFIHSDDDPYVPLDQAQYVADNCKAELLMIPGQGHFNLEKSEDYHQFPQLLDVMEQRQML